MSPLYLLKSENAHMPELQAYPDVLGKWFDVQLVDDYDGDYRDGIFWCFMGLYHQRNQSGYLIHDYRSLSTGHFPRIKDRIKRFRNPRPDLRIFLNPAVERMMGFQDGVPSFRLDMGIPSALLRAATNTRSASKKYRFAYIGEISRDREVDRMLSKFLESPYRSEPFLLIGRAEPAILERFGSQPSLDFRGLLPQDQLFQLLGETEFGVSVLPNKHPYRYQTATKLLEYAALGMKILANRGESMLQSAAKYGIEVGWVGDHIFDESIELDLVPDNATFDASVLSWERLMRDSGLLEHLISRSHQGSGQREKTN